MGGEEGERGDRRMVSGFVLSARSEKKGVCRR